MILKCIKKMGIGDGRSQGRSQGGLRGFLDKAIKAWTGQSDLDRVVRPRQDFTAKMEHLCANAQVISSIFLKL